MQADGAAPLDTPEPADPHPHPLDELSGRELLALLDEEVARMPEVYRLPLLLCVMQGRSIEEAARLLGWSIGSLRGRLTRGRERLRQRLTRRGLDLPAGVVALLAPAAVSEQLRAACLRNLVAPAAPTVSALAAGWTAALKLKAIGLGLFVVVAAGLGAALPLLRAPQPETPSAPSPAAPPAQAKDEPRRDRYDDPLPPGAITRLGTVRFRVPEEIMSLAFAPDGKTVAVYSHGGLFLIDAASGKRLQKLSLQPGYGYGWRDTPLVFSPDGKRLAIPAGKHDGQRIKGVVYVWDLAVQGKPRDYDAEHVMWIGWSAGGEPLAVCLEKDALRLRELVSGRSRLFECKNLRQPQQFPYVACACAPAGKALAVADEQNRVHIWDTATGRERCTLPFKKAYVQALSLSPDGRILASLTRDQAAQPLQLWDAASGAALHTLATDQKYLASIRFAPNGKTLATASSSEVRFWDTATGQEQGRTRDRFNFDPNLAFSSDGKTLVTVERHSRSIQFWDVSTGQRKPQPAGHRCRPHGTAFTPDGRRVATGGGLDGTIHIWDLESGESLTRIQRPGRWVRDIAFSPDGRSLFSTWDDDNLWISGAVSGGKLHVLKLEDPDQPDTYQSAISMYQSADGKTLVALSYYYARKDHGMRNATLITGWDTSTRKQLFRRRRPGMDSWVALSADARVLAVPYPDFGRKGLERALVSGTPIKQSLRLEDTATGELLLTFPTLEGQTWPLAFSPDGRLLASNNSNYKRKDKKGDPTAATGSALHLWETATAAEVLTLPLESQSKVAFSPDGRLLALIAPGQEILLYDLAGGRELRRFKGFGAGVTYLAFSPDGRRLISGLDDSTLLVWDVGTRDTAPAGKLRAEELAKAWADLASRDTPRAFRARWTLALATEEALPLLQEHLHPARSADAERLRRLLAELESEQFAVREKAQKTLEELGDLAEPALRQTLANKPTLEVRRRVQAVLEHLRGPVTKPEMLRTLRAIAVLEDIGTLPARRLLEELAKGVSEARQTREAKASLQRLHRRMASAK